MQNIYNIEVTGHRPGGQGSVEDFGRWRRVEQKTEDGELKRAMEISVQLVSRAASEKLSMKYSDLSATPSHEVEEENVPEPKRLSLQSFLISNYAHSPRRRLSLDENINKTGDDRKASPSGRVFDSRSTKFKLNEDSIIISLTPIAEDRLGSSTTTTTTMVQLKNCMATPGGLMKKSCAGGVPRSSSKTYQTLSWKYKLFYLCGVSNIDMVDNYVTLPRCASHGTTT